MTDHKNAEQDSDPYAYLRANPTKPGTTSYLPVGESEDPNTPGDPAEPEAGSDPDLQRTYTDEELGLTPDIVAGMTRRELRLARARAEAQLTGPLPVVSSTDPDQSPFRDEDVSPWEHNAPPVVDSEEAVEPRRRRGPMIALIVVGAIVLGGVGYSILTLNSSDEPGTSAAPTATVTATGDSDTPLQAQRPNEVTGSEYSPEGPSGVVYAVDSNGWVDNPNIPDGALESYVGIFLGGAEPVTLNMTRFGTTQAAQEHATGVAADLGTVVDEGVVDPESQTGHYWIFNTDGLVTIVWFDGDLGSYSIVAEDSDAALDFYQGLPF